MVKPVKCYKENSLYFLETWFNLHTFMTSTYIYNWALISKVVPKLFWTKVRFVGLLIPRFGLRLTLPMGFKARVDLPPVHLLTRVPKQFVNTFCLPAYMKRAADTVQLKLVCIEWLLLPISIPLSVAFVFHCATIQTICTHYLHYVTAFVL